MSIKLYKEFIKLIILLYSKIFLFKELFTLLITIIIVKIENIKKLLLGFYLKFTILIKVYFNYFTYLFA